MKGSSRHIYGFRSDMPGCGGEFFHKKNSRCNPLGIEMARLLLHVVVYVR